MSGIHLLLLGSDGGRGVNLTNQNVTMGRNVGGYGAAGMRLNADGTRERAQTPPGSATDPNFSSVGVDAFNWIDPKALASSAYKVRCTLIAGAQPLASGSDATGGWLALSVERAWWIATTSAGTFTRTIRLEISLDESTILATSDHVLTIDS